MSSQEIEQCEILRRICDRGCSYFLDQEDSTGIDLFEHMRNEVALLKSALIRVGELVEAHEQELQAQIDQFKPHGYLSPDGDMTSMNFDGCKRLYVKKDRP